MHQYKYGVWISAKIGVKFGNQHSKVHKNCVPILLFSAQLSINVLRKIHVGGFFQWCQYNTCDQRCQLLDRVVHSCSPVLAFYISRCSQQISRHTLLVECENIEKRHDVLRAVGEYLLCLQHVLNYMHCITDVRTDKGMSNEASNERAFLSIHTACSYRTRKKIIKMSKVRP